MGVLNNTALVPYGGNAKSSKYEHSRIGFAGDNVRKEASCQLFNHAYPCRGGMVIELEAIRGFRGLIDLNQLHGILTLDESQLSKILFCQPMALA